MRALHIALLCTCVSVATGRAQSIPLGIAPTTRFVAVDSAESLRQQRSFVPWRVSQHAQRLAPLASAVIPGTGQMMLGNDRSIAYVAVEALGWWQYRKNVRDQKNQEAEFKALARRVARARFTSESPDLLPDADWAYYEKMRDYAESGSFSLSTSGPIVPDTNVSTYNGSRWELARTTFSTREAALQEYLRTAVTPEFEWSWQDARLQYDRFKRTTDKRNDAYRAGIADLMVIGANHILSMIDAFSTIRLRAAPSAVGGSIGAQVRW